MVDEKALFTEPAQEPDPIVLTPQAIKDVLATSKVPEEIAERIGQSYVEKFSIEPPVAELLVDKKILSSGAHERRDYFRWMGLSISVGCGLFGILPKKCLPVYAGIFVFLDWDHNTAPAVYDLCGDLLRFLWRDAQDDFTVRVIGRRLGEGKFIFGLSKLVL